MPLLSAERDVLGGACVLGMCIVTDHSWIRSPDEAKIKEKMLYASSRDALRRALVGIAVEIQGTDYSEVAYESGVYLSPSLTKPFAHIICFPSTRQSIQGKLSFFLYL